MSQSVEGLLTDPDGLALPYANVYLKNSTFGVATDARGRYYLQLPPEKHTLVFSFIGYEPKEAEIVLAKGQTLVLDITLHPSATALEMVEVIANKRDRAREIMKLVREKRRDYLSAIENYRCETYIKVSLEKESLKTSENDSTIATDSIAHVRENLHLIESRSQTYFSAPDKFKEVIEGYSDHSRKKGPSPETRQISVSSSFSLQPQELAPIAMEPTNPYNLYRDVASADLNFYKNHLDYFSISLKPLLSPIAATGNLSYNYTYNGHFFEDGRKIHRILTEPIFKEEALFTGTLFIEDSTWALKAVDLSIDNDAMYFTENFEVIQNYDEIQPGIYLPTRRELWYSIVEGNDTIMGKVQVGHSNYEVNMVFKNGFFDGEVKRYTPEALDRDSAYWTQNRPSQLEAEEMKFIEESDSIRLYYVSDEYYAKIDSAYNRLSWWSPLIGVGHRNRAKGNEWYVQGLIGQVNPFGVDGYRHRLPVRFSKEFENNVLLETMVEPEYGFHNEDLKAKAGIGLTYIPKKFVRTYLTFGNYYDRINDYASVEQFFSRGNYVNTKMIGIAQRMEITNGLFGEVTFTYSDQQPVTNLRLSAWGELLYGSLPPALDFKPYTKSEVKLELQYRHRQKYIIRGNKKLLLGSKYPEAFVTYRQGIPGLFNSEVDYGYVDFGLRDETKFGRFGTSAWHVKAGTFFNKRNLRVIEYQYFRGSDVFFFSDPVHSLQLLGPTISTPNEFLQGNYIHHFDGTLLGKIPLVNKTRITLAAGGGGLVVADSNLVHFEAFAGLERVIRIKKQLIRLGAYAITGDMSRYQGTETGNDFVTFKFGINFFNPFTNKWAY